MSRKAKKAKYREAMEVVEAEYFRRLNANARYLALLTFPQTAAVVAEKHSIQTKVDIDVGLNFTPTVLAAHGLTAQETRWLA